MTETINKVNNVSQKLLKQLDIRQLKKDEIRTYEVKGIYFDKELKRLIVPGGKSIPNIDRIYDKYQTDEEGNEVGGWVDISYELNQRHGGKSILGYIEFTRENGGKITIVGGDKKAELLDRYLRLCNYNESNENAAKPGGGFIFHEVQRAKTAAELREHNKKVQFAREFLNGLSEAELIEIGKGLLLVEKDHNEIYNKLYAMAEKQPDKVGSLSSDKKIKTFALIKEAEELGVISYDAQHRQWKYADTGDKICIVPVAKKKEDAMFDHFLNTDKGVNGEQTFKTLKKAVEGLREKADK